MSARFRLFKKIIDALSALNATSTVLTVADIGSANQITFYITFGAGTNAGAVQIETAPDAAYTGTWAAEGTPVAWVAASRTHVLSISAARFAVRARISTGITGGTVDVHALANG